MLLMLLLLIVYHTLRARPKDTGGLLPNPTTQAPVSLSAS